jgi:hypothetical protein
MGAAMRSASGKPSVALVTCAELGGLDRDTQQLVEPLRRLGCTVSAVVWNDPRIDWPSFNLSIVRGCWDYSWRPSDFLYWMDRVPRLANPPSVLAWNMHKRYLDDLAHQGVPTVQTTWRRPGEDVTLPREGAVVIKPAVSLAALDTGKYRMDDAGDRELAVAHVRRLQAAGRVVMVQPYATGIDREGETSLVFIDGRFSHAVRKPTFLLGPDTGLDRRFDAYGGFAPQRCEPTGTQLAVAGRALCAVPGGADRLLYARVDLVPGSDGPIVLEVELIEPQLYFALVPGAAARFASAVSRRVDEPATCWIAEASPGPCRAS